MRLTPAPIQSSVCLRYPALLPAMWIPEETSVRQSPRLKALVSPLVALFGFSGQVFFPH